MTYEGNYGIVTLCSTSSRVDGNIDHDWFVDNGIEPKTASSLTIAFHHTVLSEAEHRVESVKSPAAFNELVSEQTPGGLNEANVNDMTGAGTFDEYTKALNTTLKRLRGEVELTKVEE